jgi:hypothetical protein
MSRFFSTLGTVTACLLVGHAAFGQTPSRVIRLIDQRCAACHGNPDANRPPDVEGSPSAATLRKMSAESIFQAITTGAMRVHAEDISDDVKRAMAEFLSGRKLGNIAAADASRMPNRCPVKPMTPSFPAPGPKSCARAEAPSSFASTGAPADASPHVIRRRRPSNE